MAGWGTNSYIGGGWRGNLSRTHMNRISGITSGLNQMGVNAAGGLEMNPQRRQIQSLTPELVTPPATAPVTPLPERPPVSTGFGEGQFVNPSTGAVVPSQTGTGQPPPTTTTGAGGTHLGGTRGAPGITGPGNTTITGTPLPPRRSVAPVIPATPEVSAAVNHLAGARPFTGIAGNQPTIADFAQPMGPVDQYGGHPPGGIYGPYGARSDGQPFASKAEADAWQAAMATREANLAATGARFGPLPPGG